MNRPSARMGLTNSVVVTTATSAASSAFGAQTTQIRVATTAACYYKVGDPSATPTAAATDVLLPANRVEYIRITPGQKIAFFNPGATMTVSVVEISQ